MTDTSTEATTDAPFMRLLLSASDTTADQVLNVPAPYARALEAAVRRAPGRGYRTMAATMNVAERKATARRRRPSWADE